MTEVLGVQMPTLHQVYDPELFGVSFGEEAVTGFDARWREITKLRLSVMLSLRKHSVGIPRS